MIFPKTKLGEKKHREHKREIEISLVIKTIADYCKDDPKFKNKDIDILEFGCGDGFQVRFLQQLGKVVASDIYTSDNMKNMEDVNFVECSITKTPFKRGQFDIVFSNHVFEYIEDLHGTFDELKRIGKPGCVYAFSVPTNIWLLLSVPGKYYGKFKSISKKIRSKISSASKTNEFDHGNQASGDNTIKTNNIVGRIIYKIFPSGQGAYKNFVDCYRTFRIKNWRQTFSDNGFSIIKTQSLLLYGPSEWPIIPTTKLFNKSNICSSVLFLMKQKI